MNAVGGGRALPQLGEECKQEGGTEEDRQQAKYNDTHTSHDYDGCPHHDQL